MSGCIGQTLLHLVVQGDTYQVWHALVCPCRTLASGWGPPHTVAVEVLRPLHLFLLKAHAEASTAIVLCHWHVFRRTQKCLGCCARHTCVTMSLYKHTLVGTTWTHHRRCQSQQEAVKRTGQAAAVPYYVHRQGGLGWTRRSNASIGAFKEELAAAGRQGEWHWQYHCTVSVVCTPISVTYTALFWWGVRSVICPPLGAMHGNLIR